MKLALLGKGIQHSKSQEMYEKILKRKIKYDLYDIAEPELIPSLEQFFKQLDGLSITAPYKTHFLGQVRFSNKIIENLGAINAIKKQDDHYIATNTDFLALLNLLPKLKNDLNPQEFVVLGSGSMYRTVHLVLEQMNLPYKHLSRKINGNISQLDFTDHFAQKELLIINCCSRDYVFQGHIGENSVFWDMNYSFFAHQQYFSTKKYHYIDGLNLLEEQAREALKFFTSSHI